MQYRVLGPLELEDQGQPLPLNGSKLRALLAILLLHANKVVSADRLIDDLWGAEPPANATASLHSHVWRLRKLLHGNGSALMAEQHGYLLRVSPGELDLHRFEQLLQGGVQAMRAGMPAAASETFGRALGLWRGTAFQCVAYEPFAQAEIERLAERRLTALEERIAADLALGRHRELVGELQGLVRLHPERERSCEELMLALYRCGRQAESLQVFQDVRRRLVESLGIEPGPALRRLQQAILCQDPALEYRPSRVIRVERDGGRKLAELGAYSRRLTRSRPRWSCQTRRDADAPVEQFETS